MSTSGGTAPPGLHELGSCVFGFETSRTLYVTEDLFNAVSEQPADDRDSEIMFEFRATLDAFLEGSEITVSEDPFGKPPETTLARVHPVELEVWDIRSIEPHPGIRCLGCFLEQDVFVALKWDYRENISSEEWGIMIQQCLDLWNNIFGVRRPLSGRTLDEYLTNYYAV